MSDGNLGQKKRHFFRVALEREKLMVKEVMSSRGGATLGKDAQRNATCCFIESELSIRRLILSIARKKLRMRPRIRLKQKVLTLWTGIKARTRVYL